MTKIKALGIEWTQGLLPLSELKEWSKNPRKITSEEYEKLKADIEKYGFHDVLKVDHDLTILSGHQRKRALKELGIEKVNVLIANRPLTEKEKEVVSIASNRHRGTFDFDLLANEFEIGNLKEAGFQDFELAFADSEGLSIKDTDELVDSANSYLDGNMKQVTLYFTNAEFEELIPRLDSAMTRTGTASHTDLFLALLKENEDSAS